MTNVYKFYTLKKSNRAELPDIPGLTAIWFPGITLAHISSSSEQTEKNKTQPLHL